jgi:hypothetical protein
LEKSDSYYTITPQINTKFLDWVGEAGNLYPTTEQFIEFYGDFTFTWDWSDLEGVDKMYFFMSSLSEAEYQDWYEREDMIDENFCTIGDNATRVCPWDTNVTDLNSTDISAPNV